MRRNETYDFLRRPFFKRAAKPIFLVFAVFYIGFHAVSGERGVFALFKETRRLEALKAELVEVTSQREILEKKVRLLSSDSLDLDLLDERARIVLGLAGKNEIVYFIDR